MFKKIISSTLAIFILFSFSVSISATESNRDKTLNSLKAQLEAIEEIGDTNQIKEYKDKSRKLINNNEVNLNAENINYDNSRLVKFKNTQQKALVLQVSSNDSTYHEMSNFAIYFDSNNNVLATTEFLVSESKTGTFKFDYYINDNKEFTQVSKEKFFTEKEYENSKITPAVDWDGFLKCMGITGALVGPLQVACTSACAIPGVGTAVCVGCIGVTIGLPSGSLIGCLTSNW
ncbi:hypothetical protein [Virgibacillus chiguensis]|uniref:Immunity protein/bacteriocin n=1 Tax=Virgibacillus chiguensis TaxID=411959 RepID=A0A1M5WBL1_9BACI|nr:hypothetical protein [Virgibacillus chiguensis]SHH84882.1 hypothetical protein SAMN05421807_115106 [Virgibacillus chiguensis]